MNYFLRFTVVLLFLGVFALSSASAEDTVWKLPPETARFKPGANVQIVTANCMVCHSADYVATQPPMNRKKWEATVLKMRDKYGATLMTNQINEIVTYLAEQYGRE